MHNSRKIETIMKKRLINQNRLRIEKNITVDQSVNSPSGHDNPKHLITGLHNT